ncbi:MAG: DegV family protein [Pseudomonadota bacterium]
MISEKRWGFPIMNHDFQKAFVVGVERVAAWSDLLDLINVFPVADGDTGRNLLVTLGPIRNIETDPEKIITNLLLSARGNSGIIAARFFSGFLTADSPESIPRAARLGRDLAWKAVRSPRKGTMLDIFDALAEITEKTTPDRITESSPDVIDHLQNAVHATTEKLPRLLEANVVDSGALGMFIYLDGFFTCLSGRMGPFRPIASIFENRLEIRTSFHETGQKHYCIDMVLKPENVTQEDINRLSEYGDSIVVVPEDDFFKIHLHADDKDAVRKKMESMGSLVKWSEEDLITQVRNFQSRQKTQSIHIMTDAAGSVTREDAAHLEMTLLDSYITAGDQSLPETSFAPHDLYRIMKQGEKASTSQASDFERHQHYQSALAQYDQVLYLCVGSFYTGNYDIAMDWKRKNDPENRFTIIDTGAASGRLGLLAFSTAMHTNKTDDPDEVKEFARQAVDRCQEYLFVDCLKYLARGGRASKTSAFFGDMLHLKPVVTPTAEGAKKVAMARNQKDQLKILFEKMHAALPPESAALILLQYTDNPEWVAETVKKRMETEFPSATIIIRPLSLTSGVHTGPGTWAVAFLPAL